MTALIGIDAHLVRNESLLTVPSEWTREYPGQEEILSYLVHVAQEYNLYQHVRFNSQVEEARWNEDSKKWHTRVTQAQGSKISLPVIEIGNFLTLSIR